MMYAVKRGTDKRPLLWSTMACVHRISRYWSWLFTSTVLTDWSRTDASIGDYDCHLMTNLLLYGFWLTLFVLRS